MVTCERDIGSEEEKMKVGIICFWDRLATPYLAKYEEMLEQQKILYDCIFWERSVDSAEVLSKKNNKYICVKIKKGIIRKIYSFLRWRRKICKVLKTEKYDNLIVLTTHPAILLSPLLIGKYKGKFVFDIRDYTQEKYKIYQKLVMKIINASAFTTISSKGFMQWLKPNTKIIPNHNITIKDEVTEKNFDFTKNPIEFTFVGNVRLDKQTEAMMLTLANSASYHMRFVGRILPSCSIEEIVLTNKIDNVSLEGPFDVSEKPEIYSGTDIINAVYANAETNLPYGDSTPIPNRLYDAIVFKCPIIASKGTYLAEIIEKYHIGIAINGFDKDVEAYIDAYLKEFDSVVFMDGCKKLLSEILEEENIFRARLITLLNEWKCKNASKF